MIITGIESILGSIVELFGVIYTGAKFLFSFFSSPLAESLGEYGPEASEFLGELAQYSPFELMFGPMLIVFLVLALVRSMMLS